MHEETGKIADLETIVVGADAAARMAVVLLHGYDMGPADLAAFGHSIGVDAAFVFPQAPIPTVSGNRAWWPIDTAARAAALAAGPRNLVDEYPPGVDAARLEVQRLLSGVQERFRPKRVVIGGFSQGGMLACDLALDPSCSVDGLIMLSASRLRRDVWQRGSERLRGLPVFVSHGRRDPDLAFSAGEDLLGFMRGAGAKATWVAFDGGHEIPLIVWRNLRNFLNALLDS